MSSGELDPNRVSFEQELEEKNEDLKHLLFCARLTGDLLRTSDIDVTRLRFNASMELSDDYRFAISMADGSPLEIRSNQVEGGVVEYVNGQPFYARRLGVAINFLRDTEIDTDQFKGRVEHVFSNSHLAVSEHFSVSDLHDDYIVDIVRADI